MPPDAGRFHQADRRESSVLDVQTERVLVVPTAVFHRIGHFQGFSSETCRYLDELLLPEHVSYRPRADMEHDPSFKQLIPYVLFQHNDQHGRPHIFQYTRGQGQGENRLHRKRSVGIGGHISSLDADAVSHGDVYREGLSRELAEEVAIESPYDERCVGLINDDESDVGRVHLGVVHLCRLERPAIEPREAEMVDCGFRPIDELLANLDHFETWSQITLRALFD
jgi:predicted NUDIX family phosphoesterase